MDLFFSLTLYAVLLTGHVTMGYLLRCVLRNMNFTFTTS